VYGQVPGARTAGPVAIWAVAAVVPELELEGGPAQGLPQDPVPHADAEHGLPPQQRLHVLHYAGHRRQVALRCTGASVSTCCVRVSRV
jgi:hypothetical protein